MPDWQTRSRSGFRSGLFRFMLAATPLALVGFARTGEAAPQAEKGNRVPGVDPVDRPREADTSDATAAPEPIAASLQATDTPIAEEPDPDSPAGEPERPPSSPPRIRHPQPSLRHATPRYEAT